MEHVIVICRDYNGYKNVLFMMKADDFRYQDGKKWGYEHLHSGKYSRKTHSFVTNEGKQFTVFSDWSVKETMKKKSKYEHESTAVRPKQAREGLHRR
jgi:hypothetical protein